MVEKTYETYCGQIHYWTNRDLKKDETTGTTEINESTEAAKVSEAIEITGTAKASEVTGETDTIETSEVTEEIDTTVATNTSGAEAKKPAQAPEASVSLIFLPGLTADHRLFEKQIEYFEDKYRVLVWDAPEHAASWPFYSSFDLKDKARWLDEILQQEGIEDPVIIGQSMGGYVGQMYLQLFPDKAKGFISIDSAPLQRQYITAVELWLLKRMEPVYRHFPWESLLKLGTEGVASSAYGRKLMHDIMMTYDGDQKRYAGICGHGYRMLAEAIEADLPYKINCPALLICGEQDHAGSCIRYNKAWHKKTGIPIKWIKGAGHNSNTDEPEMINRFIEMFVYGYSRTAKT